ncbi:MAG: MATE family efflux transporter [Candidatus Aenigmarchaeota archaeon]|nr:MATE family efflux transporter [Candidatus Aenigmarchaeota archaeon]
MLGKLRNMKRGERDLTKGDTTRTLFMLALPVIIGTSLQIAFNLTDTFFVSMMGSDALAAISVTFPVFFISIAIASGLNIGSTALISHSIGAGRNKDAANISMHAIVMALASGAAVAAVGLLFSRQIFGLMGISGSTLEMTLQYMNIIFFGFILQFLGMISQGIIQADGNTITPTKNLVAGVVANVILDPLLIFGFGPVPAMGVAGAAIATVATIAIVAVLNFYHIFSGKTSLCIKMECFKFDSKLVKKIFSIGLPSSISQSFNSIGMFLLMGLVGTFGMSAIAAFGVGIRLESIAILPSIGLMIALIPFVGQNLGAEKPDRAHEGVKKASYATILFMLFFSAIWFFSPEMLFAPFTNDPAILATGAMYFRIIALGYVFMGLNFVLGGALQAAGRTDLQLVINITRWIVVISMSYFFASFMGLDGVWLGFPIGNFAGFLLAYVLFKSGYWLRHRRKLHSFVPQETA